MSALPDPRANPLMKDRAFVVCAPTPDGFYPVRDQMRGVVAQFVSAVEASDYASSRTVDRLYRLTGALADLGKAAAEVAALGDVDADELAARHVSRAIDALRGPAGDAAAGGA